jgi:hypothetical protein
MQKAHRLGNNEYTGCKLSSPKLRLPLKPEDQA